MRKPRSSNSVSAIQRFSAMTAPRLCLWVVFRTRKEKRAGYAVRLEVMQMDMQERRACRLDAAAQRGLDVVDVVEVLRFVEVDDQMHAGATYAVADGEIILAIL